MTRKQEDKIEILGLSNLACAELRKSGVDTIQDLLVLINGKLTSDDDRSFSRPVSLRTAVLEVIKDIKTPFISDEVRERIRKKYGEKVSTKENSVKTVLNEMLRKGIIKRIGASIYVFCGEIKRPKYKSKLDRFLEENQNKEIEFRYKTERSSSDKRWRRETVWAFDERYLYAKKQYSSGHHVVYLKSRIVDYRKRR